MTEQKRPDPAFPCVYVENKAYYPGLSKREFAVIMAMNGRLSRSSGLAASNYPLVVENCVRMVDLVMEELNKCEKK